MSTPPADVATIDDYIAMQPGAVQPILQRIPKGNLSFPLVQAMPFKRIRRVARQRASELAAQVAKK